MKALVTGGGGFLGLYIVEQLCGAGHDVRVFSRGEYSALTKLGVETQHGDLRDAKAMEQACKGIDAVFHVAAVPGVWGSWETYHSINTTGTLNVIAGCRKRHVQRLIYTSSPSVVFDGCDQINANESLPYPTAWLCHYPHSKALAEQAVLAANDLDGLRTVSLRPHLIWGPRDNHLIPRLMQKARAGQLRQVGRGANVVSISYVENAAVAHLQAEASLRNSTMAAGRAYFINEPDAVNLWDWINLILTRVGLPPVTRRISSTMAWYAGSMLEIAWKFLRLKHDPPITRFVAAQLSGSHSYSILAAQRDFGYKPSVTVEEGLRRMLRDLDDRAALL